MGKKLVLKNADFSAYGITPEYTLLKCIVATSTTQFIKSPVDFPSAGRAIFEFAHTTTSNSQSAVFGFYGLGGDYAKNMFRAEGLITYGPNSSTGLFVYVNGTAYKNLGNSSDGLKHTIDITRTSAKMDNLTSVTMPTIQVVQNVPASQFGIFGFCSNSAGSSYRHVSVGVKIYSVKLYSNKDDNNSIILDAVPVLRNSDGKVGLYDKITGEYLFSDDGTSPNYEEL